MKKAILYKVILVFLLMPSIILASNTIEKGKHKKEKVIRKSFNVNADAELIIDNSYGNLDIITWSENRIEIEVTITINGNNEEKVLEKLDRITVEFEANSRMVSAKTIFNKNKSNSWWNWNNNSNVNMKINYVIKMPMSNSVDLDNNYGNINLDKLEGRAVINCDYGKITTKELMANNNELNFNYTNNCYFEYIKGGEIDADYSGFTIAKTNNIDINADYTRSKIKVAENVTYNCDYGTITIEKANNITGNSDYLTIVIGDVYKDVNLVADYGSIKIERLTKNAGNVTIDTDYVGIHIGYDSEYHFNFDIDLDYGSLRDHDNLEFNKKIERTGSKYYSGYYGSSNSGNLIKIESDYGSLTLDKK